MVNRHLSHLTALIGIPLVVVSVLLLASLDVELVRGRRVGRPLLASSVLVFVGAVGFMAYRFVRLKT